MLLSIKSPLVQVYWDKDSCTIKLASQSRSYFIFYLYFIFSLPLLHWKRDARGHVNMSISICPLVRLDIDNDKRQDKTANENKQSCNQII